MTDLPDEDTVLVRRTGGMRDDAGPARRRATFVDGDGQEQTDDSTIVARRESRRRAARDQSGAAAAAPSAAERTPPRSAAATTPDGRLATVPDPASGIRYGVRDAGPVVVPRAAPPVQPAQEPFDAAGTDAVRRRRARRSAVIVVIAASTVALGAIATLVVIAFNQ